MNTLEQFPKTLYGNVIALVMIDFFSKFAGAVQLSKTTESDMSSSFMDKDVICTRPHPGAEQPRNAVHGRALQVAVRPIRTEHLKAAAVFP